MVPITPLVDRFGRVHDSVRISVTDRCNIRCFYCMPETGAQFMNKDRLLSFEEIRRLATILVTRAGVRDIRITGGEPLVRRELSTLISKLAAIDGLEDLSMTTNGILLAEHAAQLREAGLRRVNISLDTLDADVFRKISRRDGLEKTIAGIDAAIAVGFDSVKLNSLAITGITEKEVAALVRFAIDRRVTMRFIEFMPLDTDKAWTHDKVLTGDRLLVILRDHFGEVIERPRSVASQPAEEFLVDGHPVGIIRSVTAPFCSGCNRIRITADGGVRNCLFAAGETPLRELMRSGATDEELLAQVQASVTGKAAAHGIDEDGFIPPDRPMYAIGG
ncbi:GTP 3',8-cyclase MoaA [Rubripirellula reticaptiva]|uniref:GTP 3',8-cyclase n=1 Tax=Rubripirellula reticaptiva TaxID=2528013 RepID=A0A5C6EK26_9BACT|nr:GTP 3',8-cyclase MoaA [Rubripirellula reticaptiva]TWU47981.1 Cyclic pyranopterin monophosphate synthase [Rubripirellula reticaptiva]